MGKSAKIGRLPGFVNQKKLSQGKETKASFSEVRQEDLERQREARGEARALSAHRSAPGYYCIACLMLPPVRPHHGARASLQTHAPKKYSSPPCAAGSRAGAAASRAARSRDEPRAAGFRADGHIQAPRPPPAPGGRRLTLPPRPLVPFFAPVLILTICIACARACVRAFGRRTC